MTTTITTTEAVVKSVLKDCFSEVFLKNSYEKHAALLK